MTAQRPILIASSHRAWPSNRRSWLSRHPTIALVLLAERKSPDLRVLSVRADAPHPAVLVGKLQDVFI